MSVEVSEATQNGSKACSPDRDGACVNTEGQGDDEHDTCTEASGSEGDAHDVMVLALRSQIRQSLQDEHQQEVAKVKQMYESELAELRADLITLQQYQAKQREREQVVLAVLVLPPKFHSSCGDSSNGHPVVCRGLKGSIFWSVEMVQTHPINVPP